MGKKNFFLSRTMASWVEIELNPKNEIQIVQDLLRKYTPYSQEAMTAWANDVYGNVKDAQASFLKETKSFCEDVLKRCSDSEGKIDKRLLKEEQNNWSEKIAHQIACYIPENIPSVPFVKDIPITTTVKNLSSHMKGFFTSVFNNLDAKEEVIVASNVRNQKNKPKPKINPQVPFLSDVYAQALEEIYETFGQCDLDDIEQLKLFQKMLGKHRRSNVSNSKRNRKWNGAQIYTGVVNQRQQACMIWDNSKEKDGMYLVIPSSQGDLHNLEDWLYMDGTPIGQETTVWAYNETTKRGLKNCQLNSSGKNWDKKKYLLAPAIMKHDSKRWWNKHVENHDANAPMQKRCMQTSFQFVVFKDAKTKRFRLFVRLGLSFFKPEHRVEDSLYDNESELPKCQYYIGIDRGVNSPFVAVAVDTLEQEIVAIFHSRGLKDYHSELLNQLSEAQSYYQLLINQRQSKNKIAKAANTINFLRAKEKRINGSKTVEDISKMVDWAEQEFGAGNYCFVLEKLSDFNLKKNNRVKYIALIKDALTQQMVKRGYRHQNIGGKIKVEGIRYVWAHRTSQISLSGWWDKSKYNDERWHGRNIGKYLLKMNQSDVVAKFTTPKHNGRYTYIESMVDGKAVRVSDCGTELFYDPTDDTVYNADFIGAVNIAIRPLTLHKICNVKENRIDRLTQAHAEMNPKMEINLRANNMDWKYKFCDINGEKFLTRTECVKSHHIQFAKTLG